MNLNAYSVYDTVAAAFLPPFYVPNDAVAKRSFRMAVFDVNHPFSVQPHEYVLYKVGHFDDNTGVVSPLPVIENLGNGNQFGTLANAVPVHVGEVVK